MIVEKAAIEGIKIFSMVLVKQKGFPFYKRNGVA